MEIFTDLLNAVPAKYTAHASFLMLAAMVLGRAFHQIKSGGGVVGIWRGFLYGTNAPKPSDAPPVDKRQIPLLAVAGLALLFGGCHAKFGPVEFSTVTPPPGSVVHVRASSIGLTVGQNPATQTPEATIGYKSVTYDRVPVGDAAAPFVWAGIGVNAGLGDGKIEERFEVRSGVTEKVFVTNTVPVVPVVAKGKR